MASSSKRSVLLKIEKNYEFTPSQLFHCSPYDNKIKPFYNSNQTWDARSIRDLNLQGLVIAVEAKPKYKSELRLVNEGQLR